MDDLYFENELKNKKRKTIEESLEKHRVYFNSRDEISGTTEKVFQNFDDVLDIYYSKMFGDTKNYDEICEMTETFKKELTDNALLEMYSKYNFSQEEMEYIKLVQISSTWRGYHYFDVDARYAVIDIFIRAKLIEQFGEKSLQDFRNIIQNDLPKTEKNMKMINHYMQLLSDIPYGENIQNQLENMIDDRTNYCFNQAINCGGYALKIDQCVYPTYQENFSKSVSSILEKFPFVRLLGDKALEADEYLVIYRAPKGKNTGHHFIRVDSDGTVREKDSNGEARIFENWGNLKDCMEAIFAVKKDHKMFGYTSKEINYNNSGLDFEESISKAIKNKQNSFSYHNHFFSLKKSNQDEIYVTTIEGEIVADVVIDENDCLAEVIESKKEYVENASGKIKPIIYEGKLVNYEQFKAEKIYTFDDDGR